MRRLVRNVPRGVLALAALAALAILAAACAGTPAATPTGTPAATVEIAADRMAFDRTTLIVPAGVPFAIDFENREAVPHNVSIHSEGALFVGELFGGPAEMTYHVPALAAGEYSFVCDLHPEMRGTVVSQ